jgi:predicted transposase YdaD
MGFPALVFTFLSQLILTSGLVLNKEEIQRLLRSEIMKESVTYQEILLEGETKGMLEKRTQMP